MGLPIVSKAERERAEARRLAAAELYAGTVPRAEIARRFGVTATAVRTWHKRWRAEGVDGLRSKGQPGYPPLLNERQRAELVGVLNTGPKASGFTGGWTLARVATVIHRRFGVLYRYPSAVATLLHRLGFTVQKPARRAIERDEQAITAWRTHTWSQVWERPTPAGHGSAAPTNTKPAPTRGPRCVPPPAWPPCSPSGPEGSPLAWSTAGTSTKWLFVGDGVHDPLDVFMERAPDLDPFAFPVSAPYPKWPLLRARQRECGVDMHCIDRGTDCHEELLDAIDATRTSLRM